MPTSKKPIVIVTRKLPEAVETRMRELFDARLNVGDAPLSHADLAQAVKTAHVLVPALDDRPASLSSKIVTGLLKQTLGFDGLVLSDDLGMKAISAMSPLPDATIAAIEAGCDAVLFCNSTIDEQVTALEAVIRAAESGRLSPTRLDDALGRQQRVKTRFLTPARLAGSLDVVGCAEHQAVAEEMAAFR